MAFAWQNQPWQFFILKAFTRDCSAKWSKLWSNSAGAVVYIVSAYFSTKKKAIRHHQLYSSNGKRNANIRKIEGINSRRKFAVLGFAWRRYTAINSQSPAQRPSLLLLNTISVGLWIERSDFVQLLTIHAVVDDRPLVFISLLKCSLQRTSILKIAGRLAPRCRQWVLCFWKSKRVTNHKCLRTCLHCRMPVSSRDGHVMQDPIWWLTEWIS